MLATSEILAAIEEARAAPGIAKLGFLWWVAERIDRGDIVAEHSEIILPPLIESLGSSEWEERSFACGALGLYRHAAEPALQHLRKLADRDSVEIVRSEAAKAVSRICSS